VDCGPRSLKPATTILTPQWVSTDSGHPVTRYIAHMTHEQRLQSLGIILPPTTAPAGNYAAAVRSENLLYLSGKAPLAVNGVKPRGRLGREFSAEEGYALARSACLDLISTVRTALGSLDAVAQVVELQGSLNTTAEFEDHARVLDGASDLLVEVFGEAGIHARSVIGVNSLRSGVPLTIKATLRCTPAA
jgi:enamine deaminase RidA (YjgF/YER057c/UK114 family)